MLRTLLCAVTAATLLFGAAGCASVGDRTEALRGGAERLSDQARFCLALARVVTAIESGSPRTAAEAAEEAFAQAPAEIRAQAATVVDAVRTGEASALEDPAVVEAAQRLERSAADVCDPIGDG